MFMFGNLNNAHAALYVQGSRLQACTRVCYGRVRLLPVLPLHGLHDALPFNCNATNGKYLSLTLTKAVCRSHALNRTVSNSTVDSNQYPVRYCMCIMQYQYALHDADMPIVGSLRQLITICISHRYLMSHDVHTNHIAQFSPLTSEPSTLYVTSN